MKPVITPEFERRTLAWMCLLIAVNQLGFGAIVPVLPLYAGSFGVSQTAIGLTVAVYGLARLFTGVPTGRIADLLGRRAALAIGGFISAGGNLWCAYADTLTELTIARFVAGAGAGITLTAGTIILADITTPARRGRVMAIYQGVFLFAVGIGPLPGGYLAQHYGLSVPFIAYGVAGGIAALVGWFGVTETRMLSLKEPVAGEQSVPLLQQLRIVLRPIGFKLVSGIGFFNAVIRTGGLFAIIPIIGTTRLDLTATQIGFSMALGSIGGLLVTYPAGVLVDRLGRKAVIVPANIVVGFAFMGFALTDGYLGFLFAAVTWGVASAASGAAPTAYASDISPREHVATALGTYRTLADAGYVIGPLILGLLADQFGLATPLFAASLGLMSIAVLFGLLAPETRQVREP